MHKNEVMNRFGKEPSKLFIITELVYGLVNLLSPTRINHNTIHVSNSLQKYELL